jgi:hypothetical protein
LQVLAAVRTQPVEVLPALFTLHPECVAHSRSSQTDRVVPAFMAAQPRAVCLLFDLADATGRNEGASARARDPRRGKLARRKFLNNEPTSGENSSLQGGRPNRGRGEPRNGRRLRPLPREAVEVSGQ